MNTITATRHTPLVVNRSEPRTVRVALAGCGVVGAALLELIERSAPLIAAQHATQLAALTSSAAPPS